MDGLVGCLTHREAIGETFNLGNPIETVSVRTLAQKIVTLCNSRSEIRFAPYRPEGDVTVRIPSIKKAEAALGFRPRISLDEGLAKTVAWYRDVYSRR